MVDMTGWLREIAPTLSSHWWYGYGDGRRSELVKRYLSSQGGACQPRLAGWKGRLMKQAPESREHRAEVIVLGPHRSLLTVRKNLTETFFNQITEYET